MLLDVEHRTLAAVGSGPGKHLRIEPVLHLLDDSADDVGTIQGHGAAQGRKMQTQGLRGNDDARVPTPVTGQAGTVSAAFLKSSILSKFMYW